MGIIVDVKIMQTFTMLAFLPAFKKITVSIINKKDMNDVSWVVFCFFCSFFFIFLLSQLLFLEKINFKFALI